MALTIKDLDIYKTLDQAEAATVIGGIKLNSLPWEDFASRTSGVTADTYLAITLKEPRIPVNWPIRRRPINRRRTR